MKLFSCTEPMTRNLISAPSSVDRLSWCTTWNISKLLDFFGEQEKSSHSVLVAKEVFHIELQKHWQISSFSQRKAVWVYMFQRKLIFWQTTLMSMCIFQNAVVTQCSCAVNHILKTYIRSGLWLKFEVVVCLFVCLVFFQGKFESGEELNMLSEI